MNDLTQYSALGMAELIRRREISSRELVEAHLARIEQQNPGINAVTVVLADEARERADMADRSDPTGPLHGVPITIKENIDVVGSATTDGLTARADAFPTANAPIVERMLAAGAIPIARTNLPELGLRADTDNPLRGRTKNPWDPSRSPGGSSGGEAAAIASGMSPLGLGNDVGGSLRTPAFCCGVVGFRPTMGRVPSASTINPPDPLSIELMSTDGAMGRTVADVELATRLLDGAHRRDPVSVDVSFDRAPLPRRVAGVITEPIFGPVEPAVLDGVRRAADALADDGWAIEEVTLPEFERVHEIWTRLMAADIPDLLHAVGPLITSRLADVLMEHTTFYDPRGIRPMAIFPERLRLMARWTAMFEQTPVIVGPVLA
jgi:amidase